MQHKQQPTSSLKESTMSGTRERAVELTIKVKLIGDQDIDAEIDHVVEDLDSLIKFMIDGVTVGGAEIIAANYK